jgi:myb proto-oncogene protein
MLSLSKPTARQPRKWTLAEDQKLREEVEAQSRYRPRTGRSCATVYILTMIPVGVEGEVKDWYATAPS